MFSVSTSASKWVTEPAFEVGTSVASPSANTFGFAGDCRVRLSVGTKPSASPSPGERSTKAAPPWSGNGDEQVEVELAAVVGDELAADAVDLAGVELGHQLDLLLLEQAGQVLGGDRLRERSVQRCRVDELGAAADPALAQVPIGEENELEWRNRALDRHVDQIHDQPAAGEALERTVQRLGACGAVEGEDALVPAGAGHTFGLLGLQPHAAGNDEHVVGKHRSVVEQHLVALGPAPL